MASRVLVESNVLRMLIRPVRTASLIRTHLYRTEYMMH